MMKIPVLAVALLLLPLAASAGSDEDDKLCEVIGEAPNVSVPRQLAQHGRHRDWRDGGAVPGPAHP